MIILLVRYYTKKRGPWRASLRAVASQPALATLGAFPHEERLLVATNSWLVTLHQSRTATAECQRTNAEKKLAAWIFPTILCATVALSVESQIVGYTTEALTSAKFNMHGVVFTTVDGEDMDLNTDFDFPNLTKGDEETVADIIQVWNPATSGYTTYYFYNAEGDEDNWGWVDANWELPNAKIPCGTAFWFKAKQGDGKAMTQSGALETEDDVTYDITGGKFNMHINPWPVAVDLNDANAIVIKNYTPGDEETVADIIQVWNPATSGYTTFYYYNAEGDEENWGWVDANWELPKAEIPAGAGFWYKAKPGDGKQIIFKNPMK